MAKDLLFRDLMPRFLCSVQSREYCVRMSPAVHLNEVEGP